MFFEPGAGLERVIVGVVGVLQFEVLEYRLKNEYGVDVRRSNLNFELVRRIGNTDFSPSDLKLTSDTRWVRDVKNRDLLLFTGEWSIEWAKSHNPNLILYEFNENDNGFEK